MQNIDCFLPCFGHTYNNAKEVYTQYLISILVPFIYEGLKSIYISADKVFTERMKGQSIKINFNDLFRQYLSSFSIREYINMSSEYMRIKGNSKNPEIFDNLIYSVAKAHIIVLSCQVNSNNNIIFDKTKIDVEKFIHDCYYESVKYLIEFPELFTTNKNPDDKNKYIISKYIKFGIKQAIYNLLPMNEILNAFLLHEPDQIYKQHFDNIQKFVSKCNVEPVGANGYNEKTDDIQTDFGINMDFKEFFNMETQNEQSGKREQVKVSERVQHVNIEQQHQPQYVQEQNIESNKISDFFRKKPRHANVARYQQAPPPPPPQQQPIPRPVEVQVQQSAQKSEKPKSEKTEINQQKTEQQKSQENGFKEKSQEQKSAINEGMKTENITVHRHL